jgi:hypothetical protein
MTPTPLTSTARRSRGISAAEIIGVCRNGRGPSASQRASFHEGGRRWQTNRTTKAVVMSVPSRVRADFVHRPFLEVDGCGKRRGEAFPVVSAQSAARAPRRSVTKGVIRRRVLHSSSGCSAERRGHHASPRHSAWLTAQASPRVFLRVGLHAVVGPVGASGIGDLEGLFVARDGQPHSQLTTFSKNGMAWAFGIALGLSPSRFCARLTLSAVFRSRNDESQ